MIHFNSSIPFVEFPSGPLGRVGDFDPSKPASLLTAECRLNQIQNRDRFKRDLARANRRLEVLDRQRKALDGVRPKNAGNGGLKTNSVREAEAVLNRLRASENRAPKLKSGSVAEAEGILAELKSHAAGCDDLIRRGEVNHARNQLGRLGLYLAR